MQVLVDVLNASAIIANNRHITNIPIDDMLNERVNQRDSPRVIATMEPFKNEESEI